ncbi:MAG: cytochrome c oxidase assembly protein, partial [Bowdeniella nasicola]|nr:cytochrome c oxidase assembly protein [Bowdeniella nasicola]
MATSRTSHSRLALTKPRPIADADGSAAAPLSPGRVLAAFTPITLVVALLSLAASGATAPTPPLDPGVIARWSLPLLTLVVRMAAVITIGAMTMCALVLPPPVRQNRRRTIAADDRAWLRAAAVGRVAAIIWALSQLMHVVIEYSVTSMRPLTSDTFGAELWLFLTEVDLGIAYLWATLLTAVAAILVVLATHDTSAAWAGTICLVSLVPLALTGHAAGAAAHDLAVSAMLMHLVAVAMWMGGLLLFLIVAPVIGASLAAAASRYSQIALWCFVITLVSGICAAWIRLNSPIELLTTAWGLVLSGKILAMIALGLAGWWHRHSTLPQLHTTSPKAQAFWRFAGGEVLIMGATMALAITLSSSAPPIPQSPIPDPSPVWEAIGYPEPPPPTITTWFTQWFIDPLLIFGCLAAIFVYLRWVWILRRRGDTWPLGRTICWVVVWIAMIWLTCGGPTVYGRIMFSAHMVQHMSLVMIVPIFLALAGPITLASRGLPIRHDGSRGPREWLLALVHSRYARAWANPFVAAINFVGSMWIFYFTPLFDLALTTHLGHILMTVHFTIAGYLFANVVIGIDPGTSRPGYLLRFVFLLAT